MKAPRVDARLTNKGSERNTMKPKLALENCRLIAAREIRRHDTGKTNAVLTYATWKHVIRFCSEAAGCSSLVADPNDRAPKSKRKPALDEVI